MRIVIPYSENVDDIDPIKELIKKNLTSVHGVQYNIYVRITFERVD